MEFPQDQIDELKGLAPEVRRCEEGGTMFFLLLNLELPDGCEPRTVDALLCPTMRDNYSSRLFFSALIGGKANARNWNAKGITIIDRPWYAFSWQTNATNLRLAQMVVEHVRALK